MEKPKGDTNDICSHSFLGTIYFNCRLCLQFFAVSRTGSIGQCIFVSALAICEHIGESKRYLHEASTLSDVTLCNCQQQMVCIKVDIITRFVLVLGIILCNVMYFVLLYSHCIILVNMQKNTAECKAILDFSGHGH